MTATTTAPPERPVLQVRRLRSWTDPRVYSPTVFALLSSLAFYLVRPGVNDLWAARARASAVEHGVGLGYWFSWFGGGSTPGNYSVLTPYVCAAVGTELVGALSAVAVAVLVTVLVRDTPHPAAAAAVGAVAAALNLWSGRVPFLLGAVAGVGALIAVRRRQRAATVGLTLLSILASPLAGAFVAFGLSGTFLTTRTKAYRPIIAYVVVTAAIALVLSALAFGAPGPEPFTSGLLLELALAYICLWFAGAPDHLRTLLWVTMLATGVLWAVPNGIGSNFARFVWYGLPVAVVALSTKAVRVAMLAVAPLLIIGAVTTATDLLNATRAVSSETYYTSLVQRLQQIPDLRNYRVEVVDHGAKAGYEALLDYVMLARGWETQEDQALNKVLYEESLDPVQYKVWLDNNAVGYVALPSASVGGFPEYKLVEAGQADYLIPMWHNAKWQLFRVEDPTPIVGAPASVLAHDQKSMTIRVPRAGTLAVRVRWSKYLAAVLQQRAPSGAGLVDADPRVRAKLVDDGTGWTVLTAHKPGIYVLRGSLRGGLLPR
jgi:hypothetical protein